LLGIFFLLYLIEAYPGWLVLIIGLGGAWGGSWWWVRTLARSLRLTRSRRFGWAQVGDRLEERFTLLNEGWLPGLWVEMTYTTTMPDYRPHRVVYVGGSSETTWIAEGMCTQRGQFTLGPIELRVGDPFGFFESVIEIPGVQDILVMPPILPLPGIEIAAGGKAGERTPRFSTLEQKITSSMVREYVAGDSLKGVHWPTTARRNKWYIRNFDSPLASDWWVFLDVNTETLMGTGSQSTLEHSVILTASLLHQGMDGGNQVGLACSSETFTWLKPSRGTDHLQNGLRVLAKVEPGYESLTGLLTRAQSLFQRNPSLVLVTADISGEWLSPLSTLMASGVVPTVLLLDPSAYPDAEPALIDATKRFIQTLAERGIHVYRYDPAHFDREELRPGREGRDLFIASSSNRSVLREGVDLRWRDV
jgi:uncharacterized protein (DUF58 family)